MRKPIPASDRFWPKVQKTETCWLWTAGLDSYGYGQFRAEPKPASPVKAYKFAYELTYGAVPDGLHLDHLCRVRKCVNPDHLEPIASKINTLRGDGLAAINARKTRCIRGHELPHAPNNGTYRRCNACRRERRAASAA